MLVIIVVFVLLEISNAIILIYEIKWTLNVGGKNII